MRLVKCVFTLCALFLLLGMQVPLQPVIASHTAQAAGQRLVVFESFLDTT